MRWKSASVVAAVAASVTLVACTGAPPASNSGSQHNSGSGNKITYLIGQPDTPAQLTAIKTNIKNFEKQSGVTVDLQTLPNDTLRTVIQTRLRSGNGPDVFNYDTGPGFSGVLAKAGLLYDLSSTYQKDHWTIYNWAKSTVTFDGKTYGIPDQIEEVGLFYNKDLFSQLGLQPPKTLADLTADAAKIKAAGKIPFATGDKEAWEGGHLLSMSLASTVGPAQDQKLVVNQASWQSPGVVQALTVWDQFRKDGYITPSSPAITYDNSNALFYSGKAAMDPTGTWLIQDFPASVKFNVGFIPFPSATGGAPFSTDLGGGFFMSANSKNVSGSLKFMNYLASQSQGQFEESHYQIPAFPVTGSTGSSKVYPLFKQVVDSTASYAKGAGNVGFNIDVNETDAFNQAMYNGMQALLTGEKTPQQVSVALQSAASSN